MVYSLLYVYNLVKQTVSDSQLLNVLSHVYSKHGNVSTIIYKNGDNGTCILYWSYSCEFFPLENVSFEVRNGDTLIVRYNSTSKFVYHHRFCIVYLPEKLYKLIFSLKPKKLYIKYSISVHTVTCGGERLPDTTPTTTIGRCSIHANSHEVRECYQNVSKMH